MLRHAHFYMKGGDRTFAAVAKQQRGSKLGGRSFKRESGIFLQPSAPQ
jgi:hypothetical protein